MLAMDLQASRLFQNKYVIIYDHRQQAGSYKGRCVDQKLCKREPLASSDVIYQGDRDRVVVLNLTK